MCMSCEVDCNRALYFQAQGVDKSAIMRAIKGSMIVLHVVKIVCVLKTAFSCLHKCNSQSNATMDWPTQLFC